MNKTISLIGGVAVGAGLLYVLGPARHGRPGLLGGDQAADTASGLRGVINGGHGQSAGSGYAFRRNGMSDEALVERVRARVARELSHPQTVQVAAHEGHVTLSGAVLERELPSLLATVSWVDGVSSVENNLTAYERADGVPGLQDAEGVQVYRAPAVRAATGLGGTALTIYGIVRHDVWGVLLSLAGLGMLAGALTQGPRRRIGGSGRESNDPSPTASELQPRAS